MPHAGSIVRVSSLLNQSLVLRRRTEAQPRAGQPMQVSFFLNLHPCCKCERPMRTLHVVPSVQHSIGHTGRRNSWVYGHLYR